MSHLTITILSTTINDATLLSLCFVLVVVFCYVIFDLQIDIPPAVNVSNNDCGWTKNLRSSSEGSMGRLRLIPKTPRRRQRHRLTPVRLGQSGPRLDVTTYYVICICERWPVSSKRCGGQFRPANTGNCERTPATRNSVVSPIRKPLYVGTIAQLLQYYWFVRVRWPTVVWYVKRGMMLYDSWGRFSSSLVYNKGDCCLNDVWSTASREFW